MMANNDFYSILGVKDTASIQEIKNAYRELAKKYHPDRHKGDKQAEERFKQISEAYAVLSDQKKRAQYDQMRRYGAAGNFSGNFQNFNFEDLGSFFKGGFKGQRSSGFGGFGDIFSQFFGGSDGQGFSQQRQKGQDLSAELTVPFDLAVKGGKQVFQIGSKKMAVNIPAGSEDGKKIRLRGQGEPGYAGGQSGDLILTVHVAPHPHFRRTGNDLYSTVTINVVQAILGSKVRVLTYDKGAVELKIPAGTSHGRLLKLKGFGINVNGYSGDHFVEINVDIPKNLSAKAKRLLDDFAKEAKFDY